MRNRIFSAAAWAALIFVAAPAGAAQRLSKVAWASPRNLAQFHEGAKQDCVGKPTQSCLGATPADGKWDRNAPLPFFHNDPDDFGPDTFPGFPGLKRPVMPIHPAPGPDGSPDDKPGRGTADAPPAKPPTRAEALERLMSRLAKAQDPDEAKGIAALVQRMWMQSGSDTADLLMSRALTAMGGDRHDVAAALLDQIIALRPGWAEGWNKRATLRFLDGDDTGSMEDISHVLALEPRHFGALSGMGFVLARHGEDAAALRVLRRALSVYPGDAEVRKAVDKLAPTVEGQEL